MSKIKYLLVGACIFNAWTTQVSAQSTYSGDLAALKAEVQDRAQFAKHPVIGLDPVLIREGLANVTSKDPDVWANAWMTIGDRYAATAAGATGEAALQAYSLAYRWHSFARWPTPSSPRKLAAYRKSLDAFYKWNALTSPQAQVIRFPFQGQQVTAYLRVPVADKPVPLIVQVTGLDGYKEANAMEGALRFATQGIATLVMDSPGTGEGVTASPEAWRSLDGLIRQVVAMPSIDSKHVVLIGNSYGGYWATLLAHTSKDLFTSVVAMGAPIDKAFEPAYFKKTVIEGKEYMFDVTVAWMTAFNVKTIDQLYPALYGLSLVKLGHIGKPTAPMLLLNGALDTLSPIEDLFLVARSGDVAKDVWINPQGVHLGRQPGVWDSPKINQMVVMPYVYRQLGMMPPGNARPAVGTPGAQLPADPSRAAGGH